MAFAADLCQKVVRPTRRVAQAADRIEARTPRHVIGRLMRLKIDVDTRYLDPRAVVIPGYTSASFFLTIIHGH